MPEQQLEHILIIEDDTSARRLLETAFRLLGIVPETLSGSEVIMCPVIFSGVKEAEDYDFSQMEPPIDPKIISVAVCDLSALGLAGNIKLEDLNNALKVLFQSFSDIRKVIIWSGSIELDSLREGNQDGRVEFCQKPTVEIHEIIRIISDSLVTKYIGEKEKAI